MWSSINLSFFKWGHKWKKAWTIINLPCLSFLPHFYRISTHEKKMHQNSHVLYFLSTQKITVSWQISMVVYLLSVCKGLWWSWTSASDEIINPDWKGVYWKGSMRKDAAAVWTAWLLQINNVKERFSWKSVGKRLSSLLALSQMGIRSGEDSSPPKGAGHSKSIWDVTVNPDSLWLIPCQKEAGKSDYI